MHRAENAGRGGCYWIKGMTSKKCPTTGKSAPETTLSGMAKMGRIRMMCVPWRFLAALYTGHGSWSELVMVMVQVPSSNKRLGTYLVLIPKWDGWWPERVHESPRSALHSAGYSFLMKRSSSKCLGMDILVGNRSLSWNAPAAVALSF